jgi:hypothetical protein
MGIAFKRSLRQIITLVVSGAITYGAYEWFVRSHIFSQWQGGERLLPGLAAIGVFIVAWFAVGRLIAGDAAR